MESVYRERPPPAALARQLACLWTQTVGATGLVHRVVPDGCSDIVVFDGEEPLVAGPAQHAVMVQLPAGSVIVGARFRPGMARLGFGVPAHTLRDVTASLATLWRARAARELGERLADARDLEQRVQVFAHALARQLTAEPDALVERAVRWIAAHPSAHVGAASELSDRQLLRRFHEHVGYGPKTLQRVLRFQRLLVLAEDARPVGSLAALASGAGYLDQAHMTRELKALTGQTPAVYLPRAQALSSMSDFFKTLAGATSTLVG